MAQSISGQKIDQGMDVPRRYLPGAKVLRGTLDQVWLWSVQPCPDNAQESIKAFSETSFTEDLHFAVST